MKRKLTSYILAIAVMASMSLPAFAADCRITRGTCPANTLLWQMLCQYGGTCGNSSSCEVQRQRAAEGVAEGVNGRNASRSADDVKVIEATSICPTTNFNICCLVYRKWFRSIFTTSTRSKGIY